MGKLSGGPLGKVTGKFGGVVGAVSYGTNTIRQYNPSPRNPKTEAQQSNRSDMKTATQFASANLAMIRRFWKEKAVTMSAYSAFVSHLRMEAMSGTAGSKTVNYDALLVANGSLSGADNAEALRAADKEFNISWTDNTGEGNASADDKVFLIVKDVAQDQLFVYDLSTNRSVGSATKTTVVDNWSTTVKPWLVFVSADGSKISKSVACTIV